MKFRKGCARKSLGIWNCCLFNILPKSSFSCCTHCVKNVRIRSYSGPFSVRMRENTDQNSSEYGHFLRSDWFLFIITSKKIWKKNDWGNSGFCSRFLHNIQPQHFLCLQWLLFVLLSKCDFNSKNIFKKIPSCNIDLSITLKPQQLLCSSSCCLFLLHIKKKNSVFVDESAEIWNFFLPDYFNHSNCFAVLFVFCSRL